MENTQTIPDYPRGITFEQVWAALMEDRESRKETALRMEETDRQMKETARLFEESKIETDRQIKDMNKRFDEYSNRLGEITEYMVAPKLCEKFNELGFNFSKASRNTKVTDYKNNIFFETDVFMENGEKAIIVEIKTNLTERNINNHVERLEKMRKYSDLRGDKRVFLGAVAGVVIPDDIKELAFKNGFFVVEPSGETFIITAPQGKPKEW